MLSDNRGEGKSCVMACQSSSATLERILSSSVLLLPAKTLSQALRNAINSKCLLPVAPSRHFSFFWTTRFGPSFVLIFCLPLFPPSYLYLMHTNYSFTWPWYVKKILLLSEKRRKMNMLILLFFKRVEKHTAVE